MRRAALRRTSASWAGAGMLVSGASTYLLLVVVARAVGPVAYTDFSLFWTFVVVVSLGAFLPVEQFVAAQVTRAHASGFGTATLFRRGVRASVVGAAVIVLAFLVANAWLRPGWDATASVCVVVAVLGFALQFAARGVLAGHRHLRGYATVISIDAGGRAAAAIVLWLAGVTSAIPYMVVVALSCAACAITGMWLAFRATRQAGPALAEASAPPYRGALARLVLGALCMQLLLNSSVLIARWIDPADPSLAGLLLAAYTLARLPVFAFQAAQAAYLSRVAALHQRQDALALRRLLTWLGTVVTVVACAVVLGSAILGPTLVRFVYGEGYEISRASMLLVGAGIGAYLMASVLNDVAVALGVHRAIATAWTTGVAAGVAAQFLVETAVLRSTIPLIVGAAVAFGVLAPLVLRALRSRPRMPTEAHHT